MGHVHLPGPIDYGSHVRAPCQSNVHGDFKTLDQDNRPPQTAPRATSFVSTSRQRYRVVLFPEWTEIRHIPKDL